MQLLFRIIAGVATAVGAAVSGKLLYNKGKKTAWLKRPNGLKQSILSNCLKL